MSTLFNPSKIQLEQAALALKKYELERKNKQAARDQLLRMQLLLAQKPQNK